MHQSVINETFSRDSEDGSCCEQMSQLWPRKVQLLLPSRTGLKQELQDSDRGFFGSEMIALSHLG